MNLYCLVVLCHNCIQNFIVGLTMYRILIVIIFMQLAACSTYQSVPSKSVSIVFSEPNRVSFQGKGAGAGIALMATMGPVGIALGVAIDEGIAKEIREGLSKHYPDLQYQLNKAITEKFSMQGYQVDLNSDKSAYPKLVIKRYGFKIVNGSTDATAAEWLLEWELGPDNKRLIHYPNDFEKASLASKPLADIKVNGLLGHDLLLGALKLALAEIRIE